MYIQIGESTSTVEGTYTISDNELELYLLGEYFGNFIINQDNSLTYIDEEVLPEENVPEDIEVSFVDQLDDFLKTWFTPIVSALTGLFGALSVLFACKKKVNSLTDSLAKIKQDSKENYDTNSKTLEAVKKELEAEKKRLAKEYEEAIKELEAAKKQLFEQVIATKELLQASIDQKKTIAMLKDTLVLAISSNPQFATSEYGQKMLDLLDEKEGE